MKEKVKIWSRRRLLGAFLAFLGLAAVANAQTGNGSVNAHCGGQLAVVTRTVNQMDSTNGTVIPISFDVAGTPGLVGDNYYIVAEANGSLLSLNETECSGIGDNLVFVGAGDGTYTRTATDNNLDAAVGTIPSSGKIYLKVKAETPGVVPTTYKLGIFIEDVAGEGYTQCFSDVYYITINVFQNVYASLKLHTNETAKEYICSGTTTLTDIGFDLCGIPTGITNFTLYYNLDMTPTEFGDGTVTGMSVEGNAPNGDGIYSKAFTLQAEHDGKYSMRIGQQTLTNTSRSHINTVTYTFAEGLDKFYVEYQVTEGERTRTIQLPILFITNNANCTGTTQTYTTDQLSKVFTVNLAPAFTIDALAYTTEERTAPSTTTFCQGTIAYLDAVTSSEDGTMPDKAYSWTLTEDIDGATNIKNPKSKELVVAGPGTYTFTVTAQWDDQETDGLASGNWANVNILMVDGVETSRGCKATDNVVIDVTAAPILLLATDKGTGDGNDVWNNTDVITANTVCPGELIKIETDENVTILATADQNDVYTVDGNDVDPRANYMFVGDYIKANGATLEYTVDPNGADPAVGAYTTWRNQQAPTTANLNVAHYLNNGTVAQANITYTVVNSNAPETNGCKLVKSDGSSLTDGKVQIVFPVSPRPTFQLGAN